MDLIQLLKSYLVSPPAQSNIAVEEDICPICRDNLSGVESFIASFCVIAD